MFHFLYKYKIAPSKGASEIFLAACNMFYVLQVQFH